MRKPIKVTRWVNLYYSELHRTTYAHTFASPQAADEDEARCYIVFDRTRLGNKAFRINYKDAV